MFTKEWWHTNFFHEYRTEPNPTRIAITAVLTTYLEYGCLRHNKYDSRQFLLNLGTNVSPHSRFPNFSQDIPLSVYKILNIRANRVPSPMLLAAIKDIPDAATRNFRYGACRSRRESASATCITPWYWRSIHAMHTLDQYLFLQRVYNSTNAIHTILNTYPV